jgi:hypothetical protein
VMKPALASLHGPTKTIHHRFLPYQKRDVGIVCNGLFLNSSH